MSARFISNKNLSKNRTQRFSLFIHISHSALLCKFQNLSVDDSYGGQRSVAKHFSPDLEVGLSTFELVEKLGHRFNV